MLLARLGGAWAETDAAIIRTARILARTLDVLKARDLCIRVKFLNPAFKTSRPAGGGAKTMQAVLGAARRPLE
jgi:hypothetical protein